MTAAERSPKNIYFLSLVLYEKVCQASQAYIFLFMRRYARSKFAGVDNGDSFLRNRFYNLYQISDLFSMATAGISSKHFAVLMDVYRYLPEKLNS